MGTEFAGGHYDPLYDYQIEKTLIPVIFRDYKESILAFLKKQ